VVGAPHPPPALSPPLPRGDSRVGYDDVQTTEFVEACLQCGGQRCGIAHVTLAGDDARAGVLHELDRRRQVAGGGHRIGNRCDLVTQIDGDDVGPLGGQLHRVSSTLPAGGARDERDPALERTHQGRRWPLAGSPANTGCSILMSGASSSSGPTSVNSAPTAGAALCVFSASGSAHCSTNTNVPLPSCSA